MVKGSQRWVLQIWFFSTVPNPQTTRLEIFAVQSKSFSWIPHLPTFSSFGFLVDGTVDGKNNKEAPLHQMSYFGFRQSTFFLSGFSF